MHGYPDAEHFVTAARLDLADATRTLVAGVLGEAATDEQLERAAAGVREAIAALQDPAGPSSVERGAVRTHHDYLPRSPLVGAMNPVAPPLDFTVTDGRVVGRGAFGDACEGPPGYVHGGWIALAFDEALGIANVAGDRPGMTGRLTVRYRRPTPLHTEVVLETWVDRVDGRRFTVVGTMTVDGTVTAEAEGLFVSIGAERALEYFGERPVTPEPTDPLP